MSSHEVRITDTSLRDGSHAVGHRFTSEQVARVVEALDLAGVPVIEVSHGDGLGGSSFTYGFSAVDERELIRTAVATARQARIAALLLPGVGTTDDLRAVHDLGVQVIRIATHCTEADVSIEHFGVARELGLEAIGFLMMSHRARPEVLARQARIMVEAGCQCVYVVDSAGALILSEAADRVAAVASEVGGAASVGFHGHRSLDLGVANSVLAYEAGARQLDGSSRALGAGAGNAATEVLAAVLDRLGVRTGIDLARLLDAAEDVVRPLMEREAVPDRLSIIMGFTGVYSSFLKHAEHAAHRYGVSGTEILRRAGERELVGGQEDQLLDIALELASVSRRDDAVLTTTDQTRFGPELV